MILLENRFLHFISFLFFFQCYSFIHSCW